MGPDGGKDGEIIYEGKPENMRNKRNSYSNSVK